MLRAQEEKLYEDIRSNRSWGRMKSIESLKNRDAITQYEAQKKINSKNWKIEGRLGELVQIKDEFYNHQTYGNKIRNVIQFYAKGQFNKIICGDFKTINEMCMKNVFCR